MLKNQKENRMTESSNVVQLNQEKRINVMAKTLVAWMRVRFDIHLPVYIPPDEEEYVTKIFQAETSHACLIISSTDSKFIEINSVLLEKVISDYLVQLLPKNLSDLYSKVKIDVNRKLCTVNIILYPSSYPEEIESYVPMTFMILTDSEVIEEVHKPYGSWKEDVIDIIHATKIRRHKFLSKEEYNIVDELVDKYKYDSSVISHMDDVTERNAKHEMKHKSINKIIKQRPSYDTEVRLALAVACIVNQSFKNAFKQISVINPNNKHTYQFNRKIIVGFDVDLHMVASILQGQIDMSINIKVANNYIVFYTGRFEDIKPDESESLFTQTFSTLDNLNYFFDEYCIYYMSVSEVKQAMDHIINSTYNMEYNG
jgi:hypothetical protein